MTKIKYFYFFFLIILSGCVTIESQTGSDKKKPLTSISRVKEGMSYQEVQAVMDGKLTIGYESLAAGGLQPIVMDNPVRIDKVIAHDKTYFVLYYLTQIVKPDGLLSEEELTPLVFEAQSSTQNISSQDPLVGKGQDFVFRLKN